MKIKYENKNENKYNDEFMLELNNIPLYNYVKHDKKSETNFQIYFLQYLMFLKKRKK